MILKLIFAILICLSVLSTVAPIVYSIKKRSAFNAQLKALFLYLIVALSIEIVSVLFFALKIHIRPMQFGFGMFEFLIIVYLYWCEFNKRSLKIVIALFAVSYFIGLIVSYYLTGSIAEVIDVSGIIESILIIILSVVFFFKVLTDLKIPKLTNYPFFWFNSAFLVYFGATFFLFLFNTNLKSFDDRIVYFLTGIHHIVNIAFNILLAIGICKVRKT